MGRLPGRADDRVEPCRGPPGRLRAPHEDGEVGGPASGAAQGADASLLRGGGWRPLPQSVAPTPRGSGLGLPQTPEAVMSVWKKGGKQGERVKAQGPAGGLRHRSRREMPRQARGNGEAVGSVGVSDGAAARPENQLAAGGRGAGVPTCSLPWILKVGAWLAGVTPWWGLCMASTLATSGTAQGLVEITGTVFPPRDFPRKLPKGAVPGPSQGALDDSEGEILLPAPHPCLCRWGRWSQWGESARSKEAVGTSCLRRIPLVTLPGPFLGAQLPPETGTILPDGQNSHSSKQTHIFLV